MGTSHSIDTVKILDKLESWRFGINAKRVMPTMAQATTEI